MTILKTIWQNQSFRTNLTPTLSTRGCWRKEKGTGSREKLEATISMSAKESWEILLTSSEEERAKTFLLKHNKNRWSTSSSAQMQKPNSTKDNKLKKWAPTTESENQSANRLPKEKLYWECLAVKRRQERHHSLRASPWKKGRRK